MVGFLVKKITDTLTTVANVSGVTTITPNAEADIVYIQANTQNIRVTQCGTNPSATAGMRVTAGAFAPISTGNGVTIKVIEEAASASINWYSVAIKRDTDL